MRTKKGEKEYRGKLTVMESTVKKSPEESQKLDIRK